VDEQRVQEQTVQTFAYGLFIDVPHKDMVVSTAVILLVFPLAWTTGLRTDADDERCMQHFANRITKFRIRCGAVSRQFCQMDVAFL
jgi:hypothetical protein